MLCFHYHSVWNTLKPPLWFLLCCCSVVVSDTLQHYGLLARQASLSFTISQSLLKFMIIESLMPSKHLILFLSFFSCLQSFQHQGLFQLSRLVTSGGWSFGSSVSVPVLAMNIQGWFPLGLTGLISLQFKETVPLSPERDFTKLSGQKVLGMKPEYHSHESYMLIVVCNT